MSLRLKSELAWRWSPRGARLALWPAGWGGRPAATVHGDAGDGAFAALHDALAAQVPALPTRVRLRLDDGHLFYRLHDATGAWGAGREAAVRGLREATGLSDLQVATTLTPCGRHWLAVGVSLALLAEAEAQLAERGARLVGVEADLPEDLRRLGRGLPDDGLVVLPRTDGAMLVRLDAGGLTDIAWEHGDPDDLDALAARVDGHLSREGWPDGVTPTVLLAPADADQATCLAGLAQRRGWTLAPAQGADA